MTQAISGANVSGFASELAVLLIENETNQADSARLERDAARQSFLDQAQQQVDALHEAANATMAGALVSASLSVAGGACLVGAASYQFQANMGVAADAGPLAISANKYNADVLSALATTGKLADPLKALIGDSTAAHYQAEAKHHEILGEQAKWQASDASSALDKADKQGDKVLDLLAGIQRDQNSATNAVIGRI